MRLIDADAYEKAVSKYMNEVYGCELESESVTHFQEFCDDEVEVYEVNGLWIAKEILDEASTIEAEPVRHGRWEESDCFDDGFWVCSNCKFTSAATAAPKLYKFCPNCGTKMDGKENENE